MKEPVVREYNQFRELTVDEKSFVNFILDGVPIVKAAELAEVDPIVFNNERVQEELERRLRDSGRDVPPSLEREGWLAELRRLLYRTKNERLQADLLKMYGQAEGWFKGDTSESPAKGLLLWYTNLVMSGLPLEDVPEQIRDAVEAQWRALPPPPAAASAPPTQTPDGRGEPL